MIRKLLATTAIATLVASGAIAQTTTPSTDPMAPTDAPQTEMTIRAEGHLASNLIGESVYNGTGEDAENIGEVTDLVITPEGEVEAIVVGVGGFLGIGQKEVALQYDLVEWSEQQDGERWMIVETTRDALEAQQDFDRAAYRPMPADADVAETRPATAEDLGTTPAEGGETAAAPADDQADVTAEAPADSEAPADEQTDMAAEATADAEAPADEQTDMAADAPADSEAPAVAIAPSGEETGTDDGAQDMAASEEPEEQPADQETAQAEGENAGTDQTLTGAVDPSQMQEAQPDQIRAENLTGTTVYGADEERVGEIGDVILTPEGDVDAIIVDVGGFLGIGEKEVSIGMDNLSFMTDEGGDLYLFTEFTQEELEAAPEYDEATYAEQRDTMRLQ